LRQRFGICLVGLRKTTGRIVVAGPKLEPRVIEIWLVTESNVTPDAYEVNYKCMLSGYRAASLERKRDLRKSSGIGCKRLVYRQVGSSVAFRKSLGRISTGALAMLTRIFHGDPHSVMLICLTIIGRKPVCTPTLITY
jgi:hypothetical protein